MDLSAEEIRVLGCLIEKQLTTPAQYPLTESAVVTACNQATNRDPVVSYDKGTVRRTLLSLRQQGLARLIHRPGDRVEKHRHLLDEALSLEAGDVAVLCVLMLRGPQTPAELRTRTERLHPFSAPDEVQAVLDGLATRDREPLVARLERRPGQKEARYTQLLGEQATVAESAESLEPRGPRALADVPIDVAAALREELAALRARVDRLERELGL